LFGYQTFWAGPREKERQAAVKAQQEQAVKTPSANTTAAPNAVDKIIPRDAALKLSQRVQIDAPLLKGSISTFGSRLDDISLKNYKQTIEKNSPNVTLLSPQGAEYGYYASYGWADANNSNVNVPTPNTVWKVVSGTTLTPTAPVVLEYDNGQGLKFTRKIEIDKGYVFTFTDSVTNTGAAAVKLQPYGILRRFDEPPAAKSGANHQGTVGILADKLSRLTYHDLKKGKSVDISSNNGWLGFSDEYWLVSLLPKQGETFKANMKAEDLGNKKYIYETSFFGSAHDIAAGQTITNVEHIYSGAKDDNTLQAYGKQLNLPRFEDAIDWGKLWFITKPFHWFLIYLDKTIGSLGLAILAFTVVVKVATFPLVYQSYKSFAKMRDLGPKMKEIQEKFKDDKQKQQQATLEFYQKEKVNPVAGCIPMIMTMPIFLALYKTLSIAIELRHAPFYGWVKDLSAKDPSNIFNLFGALPFNSHDIPFLEAILTMPVLGGLVGIGLWPILYGLSMVLLQKMQSTAPQTDPTMQQVMTLMPIMFTFMFASFSSGLVIYYTWSNLLTIVQQYVIAKRQGSSTPIDEFFAKLKEKKGA
jgi:YidC/Oxa1 family membrane protein insertase